MLPHKTGGDKVLTLGLTGQIKVFAHYNVHINVYSTVLLLLRG